MPTLPLYRAAAIVVLILCNAFFVAAEFALVSLRRTRVQQLVEEKRPGAQALAGLQGNLDQFLPAVQLGVTLASLLLGWLGEPFVARLLLPGLAQLPHARFYGSTIAAAIAFCLIAYLEVIFGELVPKSLALRQREKVALAVAGPMRFFMRITGPAIRVLNASADAVLRLFRLSRATEGSVHSTEELKLIATATRHVGLLPPNQEKIIHRVLDLDTITVREIMTPRQRVFSLPADLPLTEANARITQIQRSRVPVFDPKRGPEHIVGIVYAKDLARLMHFRAIVQNAPGPTAIRDRSADTTLEKLMCDILSVPETMSVADLLTEFQECRRHMAVVVDEFGSVTGLVTVEDVLEQIVGEMEDEFDAPDISMERLSSGSVDVHGSTTLLDLEMQLGWKLPHEAGVETMAGFLLAEMQKIPVAGDTLVREGRRFTIIAMEGRRITRVRVESAQKPQKESKSSSSNAAVEGTRRPQ